MKLLEWAKMGPRERDALIAVEIMGWDRASESWYDEEGVDGTRFTSPSDIEVTAFGHGDDCEYGELDERLPPYTSDIAAAWEVVEKVRNDRNIIEIRIESDDVTCSAFKDDIELIASATCELFCEAVCICALRVAGYEVDDGKS
jgi:hypothetical protein